MIVSDCTLIAQILIPGGATATAEKVVASDPDWIVPPLWRSEMRNVFRAYLVAGKMKLEEASRLFERAEERLGGREYPVSTDHVLALVAATRCSAYDAEYVALAQASSTMLVTNDARLRRLFPTIALSPEEFLEMKKR
ncbi:MAG TPA: type II toxin-antitoxin system VapC family toxin [Gemmatimonadaceae bacterium]|nr:type II toxin-antitoxin system VapC family toxin [Gemmatimonadaceae bacterium]